MINKTGLAVFILGLLTLSASHTEAKASFDSMNYSAVTLGASDQITLDKTKVRRVVNGKKVTLKRVSPTNLVMLYKLIGEIDLVNIHLLDAPTTRYRFDGAMLTTIEVQMGADVFRSVSFDHDNPPYQLKPLVDYLVSL